MAYCVFGDVRYLIDTGMADADITALIVLADAEILSRQPAFPYTANYKLTSALITASLVAMRDDKSRAVGETGGAQTAIETSKQFREMAEALILKTGEPCILCHNDLIENDYDTV